MLSVAWPLTLGVHFHQIDGPAALKGAGSPVSRVAPLVEPQVSAAMLAIVAAAAKLLMQLRAI